MREAHPRRYPTDLPDAEWVALEPLLSSPGRTGWPLNWPLRLMAEAMFYLAGSGCTWRLLPDSFPPWRTVYRWFVRLRDDGVFEAINHHLVMLDCERAGREASPTTVVIDSQTAKAAKKGALHPTRPATVRARKSPAATAAC
jgi:putative transposase